MPPHEAPMCQNWYDHCDIHLVYGFCRVQWLVQVRTEVFVAGFTLSSAQPNIRKSLPYFTSKPRKYFLLELLIIFSGWNKSMSWQKIFLKLFRKSRKKIGFLHIKKLRVKNYKYNGWGCIGYFNKSKQVLSRILNLNII